MPRRTSDLSPEQHEFIDWLIEPQQTRDPKTQKEFGKTINAPTTTLSKWKKDMKFREEWDRRLHDLNISPDRIQSVIDSMWAQACRGNVKAAELYLKYTDRFTPQVEITHVTSVEELSDEELENEYQGYLSQEVARRMQDDPASVVEDPDDE